MSSKSVSSGSRTKARIRSPAAVPPGSRDWTMTCPSERSRSQRIWHCVLVPEPSIRLNKAIAMQGLQASGVTSALIVEGALSALAHSSHDDYREKLHEAQRTGGVKAYLQMRDGPFQPEPMGPRSAKARAARAAGA